jgi:hypothetical protein
MPKKLKHKDTEDTGTQTDVVDLIVVIPDDEYADVDTVIVQIDLVDANA